MSSPSRETRNDERGTTNDELKTACLSAPRSAFRLRRLLLLCVVAASLSCATAEQQHARVTRQTASGPRSLRVCADPNNLPFSNERGEGFENRIAELLASDMRAELRYTWWAQRRGFVRHTLRAGECDVVLGVPSSFELAQTTAPYYRSTYVFVSRQDRHLNVRSFDDPHLRQLKIGVQLIGDDAANSPPVHALSARHIVGNVRGYTVYGDYSQESPPARIVEAVACGEVDVAVVWGPLAGYYARRQKVALEVVPVSPQVDPPFLPFVFDISMGVRRGDDALREELEEFLERRRDDIERILDEYGVPRVGRVEG
jgi:mxaJ protein